MLFLSLRDRVNNTNGHALQCIHLKSTFLGGSRGELNEDLVGCTVHINTGVGRRVQAWTGTQFLHHRDG